MLVTKLRNLLAYSALRIYSILNKVQVTRKGLRDSSREVYRSIRISFTIGGLHSDHEKKSCSLHLGRVNVNSVGRRLVFGWSEIQL